MRPVADELRDGEAALADVLIEDSIRKRALCGNEMHVRFALHTFAEVSQLWNLGLGNRELALRGEVHRAGVFVVELLEAWADLAPDACLFGRVVDDRMPQPLEPVLPAQRKERLAPLDVPEIAQARVTGLEFQLGRFRRRDHVPGIDRCAVFGQRCDLLHANSTPNSQFPTTNSAVAAVWEL